MNLLLIEDDLEAAKFLQKGLKESGYTVSLAVDGRDGLRQAQEQTFDLLITDRMLPHLDGLALVRALRESHFPGRIMILSGFLSGAVEKEYEALGVDQVLSKPFTVARLREGVERAVHAAGCGA